MLAVGRPLMAKPKMILMDEPSMGLSPLLVKEIFSIIREGTKRNYHFTGGTECKNGLIRIKQGICYGDRENYH